MKYVYILQSINSDHFYIGLTDDLRRRLAAHNAGQAAHTRKFKPWRLATYIAFSDGDKAVAFERYLKSSSGRAFAKKRSVRQAAPRGFFAASNPPADKRRRAIA